jgi:protein-L-isoaspartate O-methyltransferase
MRQQLKEGVKVQVVSSSLELFPTPPELCKRMVEILDIESSDQVLEPSAGLGNILREIKTGDIVAVELDHGLYESLIKNFPHMNIYCDDFLEVQTLGRFDKIAMNPPFSKGQDVDHVMKAYSLLRSGGTLCAVMGEGAFFRRDKKCTEFRDFLDSITCEFEKLPEGTFKNSGTMTNTRLLTIWKD